MSDIKNQESSITPFDQPFEQLVRLYRPRSAIFHPGFDASRPIALHLLPIDYFIQLSHDNRAAATASAPIFD
jgi:hypothetical protein